MKLSDIMEMSNSMEGSDLVDPSYSMESADIIKKQVDDILKFCLNKTNVIFRNKNMDEYKQVCMRQFTNFHQKYPTLFFSIIENPTTFPLYRFNEMIQLKKNIEFNNLSEKDASIQLGQKYYNEFVKETVSDLDNNIKN
jgi:hypothetical protein